MTVVAAFAGTLLMVSAACVLVAVSIAVQRARHRRAAALRDRLAEPLRPALYDLLAGDPPASEMAARRLRSLDAKQWDVVRDMLVEFCGKFRGESLGPVLAILASRSVGADAIADLEARSPVRRGRGARTLGLLRLRSAREQLEELLGEHDPDVRIAAARALGHIGDPAAATALFGALAGPRSVPLGIVSNALLELDEGIDIAVRAALQAPDRFTRAAAADIIGLRGSLSLAGVLRGALSTDPDPDVRMRAAASLGRLGAPTALPELIAATEPGEDMGVRSEATASLGMIGDPGAVRALGALLAGHDLLADVAAHSLVQLGFAGVSVLLAHAVSGTPSPSAGALAVAQLRGEVPTLDSSHP